MENIVYLTPRSTAQMAAIKAAIESGEFIYSFLPESDEMERNLKVSGDISNGSQLKLSFETYEIPKEFFLHLKKCGFSLNIYWYEEGQICGQFVNDEINEYDIEYPLNPFARGIVREFTDFIKLERILKEASLCELV